MLIAADHCDCVEVRNASLQYYKQLKRGCSNRRRPFRV